MTFASIGRDENGRRWGALAVIVAAQFMVILDVAIVIWGAASGSGGAAGVLLGGLLTSYLHWSWIFFINIPVGAAVIALTPWLLRESRIDRAHRHFDVAGAASVTAGLMLLVYAMTRATQHGWGDVTTIALLGAAALLLVAFVTI